MTKKSAAKVGGLPLGADNKAKCACMMQKRVASIDLSFIRAAIEIARIKTERQFVSEQYS